MMLIKTTLIIEIDDDVFEDEFGSDEGRVLYRALEHGDAGGEFVSNWAGGIKIEDVKENA